MAGLTVQQAFEQALRHQQGGRVQQAEALYRQIITHRPNLAEVHNNLGNALKVMGRLDEAAAEYRRALSIRSDIAQIHNNLGSVLHEKGYHDDALAEFGQALALRADYPEAHYNLGNTYFATGRFGEAIAQYRSAIALWPSYAEAHCNLGNALAACSRRDEAIVALRQAVWLRPNYPEAWNNLANELRVAHRLGEAIAAYKQAVAQRPQFSEAYNNLGNALRQSGRLDEAIEAYQQAISRRRDFAEAFYNLGIALTDGGRLDEAVEVFHHALQLRPDFPEAYQNLAGVFREMGELNESLACCRQALSLKAEPRIGSDLVYTLCFNETEPHKLLEEAQLWNDRFARPLEPQTVRFDHDRNPDRKLRIGYVSPDFREHPVGRFILPLLTNHDRTQFEVFCYSDLLHPDALSEQLKAAADPWRSTIEMSDEQVSQLIRGDQIDVLVDLTMHMRGSRLLAFARKPAPVQVTYLAYAGTTGLHAMDYRLSDPFLDPLPGASDHGHVADDSAYSERTFRLPQSYWCYDARVAAPEPGELPALARGHVTFGCLNNFAKVNANALLTWCRLLARVGDSRLILHAPEGRTRNRLRGFFEQQSIDPTRLDFVEAVFPLERYLGNYRNIDIALDPFPYPGGATTCDALWVGVPVVSLAGNNGLFRAGVSILSNIGLPELIAEDVGQYLDIASALAGDLSRLSKLRCTLRSRMQASPLMDAGRFTRGVEAAFRSMWRAWCGSVGP